ncbi:hypothetical protein MRX96_037799 [Rhipicephalus microplus]
MTLGGAAKVPIYAVDFETSVAFSVRGGGGGLNLAIRATRVHVHSYKRVWRMWPAEKSPSIGAFAKLSALRGRSRSVYTARSWSFSNGGLTRRAPRDAEGPPAPTRRLSIGCGEIPESARKCAATARSSHARAFVVVAAAISDVCCFVCAESSAVRSLNRDAALSESPSGEEGRLGRGLCLGVTMSRVFGLGTTAIDVTMPVTAPRVDRNSQRCSYITIARENKQHERTRTGRGTQRGAFPGAHRSIDHPIFRDENGRAEGDTSCGSHSVVRTE